MRFSNALAASVVLLAPTAFAAFSLSVHNNGSPISKLTPRELRKRQIQEPITNLGTGLAATIEIGTPPQTMSVALEITAGDLWVFENTAVPCKESGCKHGDFDRSASSSFTVVSPGGFSIPYTNETSVDGDFITETFSFGGGETLSALQMGLVQSAGMGGDDSRSAFGVMGIGYNALEWSSELYPNVPDQLVAQGLIETKTYSIHLNDLLTNFKTGVAGSIVFGGIDTDKFVGTLKSIPIVPADDGVFDFPIINLGSLSLTTNTKTTELFVGSARALVRTGYLVSFVPRAAATTIYEALGAYDDTDGESGYAWVDCNAQCTMYNASFSFGHGGSEESDNDGLIIKAQVVESISSIGQPEGLDLPWEAACAVDILPSPSPEFQFIFGDNIVKSTFTVFDLANNEMAFAQSNFRSTSENIQNIPKGSTSIPQLFGNENGVTKLPIDLSCSDTFTQPPSTSTESPSSSTEPSTSSTEVLTSSTEPPTTSTKPSSSSTGLPSTYTDIPTSSTKSSTEPVSSSTRLPSTSTDIPSTSTDLPTSSIESSTSTESPSITPSSTNGGEGPTTTPSSSLSSTNRSNSCTTAPSTITATYTTTSVYPITSCPPAVTDCPLGHVTTEIGEVTTTYYPGEVSTPTPSPTYSASEIKVISQTIVYTITKCPVIVTNCAVGQVTTEVITYGTIYPVSETEGSTPPSSAGEEAGGSSLPYSTTLVSPEGSSGGETGTGGVVYPTSTGFPEFTGGMDRITVDGLSVVIGIFLGLIGM